MKSCPNCGVGVVDAAKFCFKCGFNIKKYEEEKAKEEIFCPECGAKIPEGDFCTECGSNIASLLGNSEGDANGFGGTSSFGGANSFGGLGGDVFGLGSSEKKELAPFTYEEHTDGTYTVTGLKDKLALTLTVPSGVVAIADNAFEGCEAINITLPDELLKIGNASFKGAKDLANISLPNSLVYVGDEAFMDCVMLDIELPKSVRKVGKDAMKNTVPDVKRQKEEEKRKAEEEAKRKAEEARKAKLAKWDVGKIQTFGTYNGKPIEWIVLKRDEEKAFIISKYPVDRQVYNINRTSITWENCTLRKWLNSEFLENAFDSTEKNIIRDTLVNNPNNLQSNTKGGNATTDKIFLLSISEVNAYFSSDSDRKCESTEFVKSKGASIYNGYCWWWLRSPGDGQDYAETVRYDGNVVGTIPVIDSGVCVRPVMWVSIQ